MAFPEFWYFLVQECEEHLFELQTHYNCTFNSFLQIGQTLFHYYDQYVESLDFLHAENIKGINLLCFL